MNLHILKDIFISERNYNEIKTMAYVIGNGLKWQKSCHTSGAGPEMYQGNDISVSIKKAYSFPYHDLNLSDWT